MALAILPPENIPAPQLTIYRAPTIYFPDLEAAHNELIKHCQQLPSSATPEAHTIRSYIPIANRFFAFCRDRQSLPDMHLMTEWKTSLVQKKYADATIQKYMTVARLLCKYLAQQYIDTESVTDLRQYITLSEIRQSVLNASMIPDPPKKVKSDEPGNEQHGVRLSQREAQDKLDMIDMNTLDGKRDKALLLTFLLSGLRLAEISRLTLANISESAGTFIIKIRRKGGKYNKCALPYEAYRAIQNYVKAWNNGLDETDPRYIGKDDGLWRPITPTGKRYNDYRKSISTRAISKIVHQRLDVAPHDLRRTWSALAKLHNMPVDRIQKQMAHESIETTMRYIGTQPQIDYSLWDITRYGVSLK